GMEYDVEQGTLAIRVTDTGIGMTPDEVARLFKPFSQVDQSMSRRFGGTGLGLCITKHIAEALGGRIEVSSERGTGSTFLLVIAASNPGAATRQEEPAAAPGAQLEAAPQPRCG